jgi:hypothetical protein
MNRDRAERAAATAVFVALLATGIALGGALAHLFELPNKIGMARDAYFTMQRAYDGWNRLAFVLLVELLSMIAVAVIYRRQRAVLVPALLAILGLLAAQALFWTFTFPANSATANWTQTPVDWQRLRAQWEWSHAGGALCQLAGFSALIVAALNRQRLR